MTTKRDWHEQVENERMSRDEVYQAKDGKTICSLYHDENDTIFKTTNTSVEEERIILAAITERKIWKKFGDATNDPPGINPATTKVGDEIRMNWIVNTDENKILRVVNMITSIQCRWCEGKHLSATCSHENRLQAIMQQLTQETGVMATSSTETNDEPSRNKYIPPHKRSRGSVTSNIEKQDEATIRVSNLPEETEEQDLHDLFDRYGRITRIHLPIDRVSKTSKDFAFVTFTEKKNAQMAMNCLNGYGYGNLILQIEWAANKSKNYYN